MIRHIPNQQTLGWFIVAALGDSVGEQENVQNEATFSVTGNPDDIICYDAGGIALVYASDDAKEKGHFHKMILYVPYRMGLINNHHHIYTR